MPDEPSADTPTAKPDIFISRNNQTHGPYPRDVVENWINTGKINRYDLACTDKTPWQPIAKLLGPDQFAKATSGFTGKQWGLIVAAIVGLMILAAVVSYFDNQQKGSVATGSSVGSNNLSAATPRKR